MKQGPSHTACSDPVLGELLVPFGLGTLDSEAASRFEEHLMECAHCREELEAGYAAFSALQSERTHLVAEMREHAEDFESRLARLERDPSTRRAGPGLRPLLDRLRAIFQPLRNPWVYGPLMASTAVLMLVLQMSEHTPVSPFSPPMRVVDISQLTKLKSTDSAPRGAAESPPAEAADQVAMNRPTESRDDAVARQKESPVPVQVMALPPATESISSSLAGAAPPPAQSEIASETAAPALAMTAEAVTEPSPMASLQERVQHYLNIPPLASSSSDMKSRTMRTDHALRAGRPSSDSLKPEFVNDSPLLAKRAYSLRADSTEDYDEGLRAYRVRDYLRADSLLSRVVSRTPGNAPGWFYLGAARMQQKSFATAVAAFERADSLTEGHDTSVQYYLALLRLQSGQLTAAKPLLERLASRPDSLGLRAQELIILLDKAQK